LVELLSLRRDSLSDAMAAAIGVATGLAHGPTISRQPLRSHMLTGKQRDRLMYTIELTEGPGWDAPTLQARAIKTTVDIAKVAALAADWLHETQQSPSDAHRPDGWRIVDGIGRRIKTSEV